jgi:hypothetical protein
MVALVLSGCAASGGLSQLSLLGGGATEPETEAEAGAPQEVTSAEAPPIPLRNARIKRAKPSAQLASGPAPEAPKAERTAGLSLPNLSDVKIFTASTQAPDSSSWEGAPIAVYTQLAQEIRACWFTPGTTQLTKHGFHAEVSPNDADHATIIIYEKDPEGRRGVQAFRIAIDGGLSGSTVRGENRRLDKTLEAAFKADLVRWSKGGQGCKV